MEEASSQQQGAAFPAPPYYFQRYTEDNLHLLENARRDPDNVQVTKRLEALAFPILALEPPPPVKKGAYWLFGRSWPIQDSLATLEEQGIEQLYPKGPIDRVKELKRLDHSAVFNFLELVHTLATSPNEFAMKVDHIRVIFINMHHILNEYRPHQARETLRLMMEDQLNRKRKETAALKRTCVDLRRKLAMLRNLKQERLRIPGQDMDIDRAAEFASSPEPLTTTTTTVLSPSSSSLTSASRAASTISSAVDLKRRQSQTLAISSHPVAGTTNAPATIAGHSDSTARLMDLCDDIE
ncbi:Mediator of RNA polymerase II transcription subunit 7 [Dissophora globulifera]|uniref:Mediator of RNA polymerase II transcription subunit 7 n=1 Tax=Dissophora globulifera TaxID=979702 RepID=A0A9P6QZD8_9FUNG|nr:Mediator of RNA polymerase II transcription subunit 7 [Dissophora globulifera]